MTHKNVFSKSFSLFLAVLMLMACIGTTPAAAAETTWTLTDTAEIFWVKNTCSEANYDDLSAQVRRFSADLAEKVTGEALPVSYGDISEAAADDMILILDSGSGIPAQGYSIAVTGGNVTVTASDAAGMMYGCNALIQQLMTAGAASAVTSSPDVAERALFLDIGRKYYSVQWIKDMIRELAWSNMNTLVVHFSEEMGLGLESKQYPWLNGRDGTLCTQVEVTTDNRYITQAEMADIIAYARAYHVEIVPSFDSPGHMNYIVKKFNEKCGTKSYSFTYDGVTYTAAAGSEIGNYYHYNGQTSIVKGSRNANYSRGIDISNEVAVAFTRSLVEEYARFFREQGCTRFDIGGDELLGWGSAIVSTSTASRWQQLDHWKAYAQNRAKKEGLSNWSSAVAYDGFMYYMNDMYDLVAGLGYTSVRMWNDDAYRSSDTGWKKVVNLNEKMEILFWTPSQSIWNYGEHGLYNYLSDYNYLALTSDWYSGNRGSFTKAYPENIYNEWNPYNFGSSGSKKIGNETVKGSAVCIWSDNPALRTEAQIRSDILPLLRANGAKAWDSNANESVSYTQFAANQAKIGDAPADGMGPEIYPVADCSALSAAVGAFESVKPELYTEDSYAAYSDAVNAGKQLLAADKPAQQDVDDAVAAITAAYNALALRPTADTSALERAIVEYEATDESAYTPESFRMYTAAVEAARQMLSDGGFVQEQVDEALAEIEIRKNSLRTVDTVSNVECFISGSFKTKKVYVGKVATMGISVIKGSDIVGFEIYNDANTTLEIVRQVKSTQKSDRDNWTIIFKPSEAEAGTEPQTYRVYAVYSDGTRSADYVEMSILVISNSK